MLSNFFSILICIVIFNLFFCISFAESIQEPANPKCTSYGITFNKFGGSDKNLSGLWHMEYIGADLVKSFVNELPKKKLKNIRIGMLDASLHFQSSKRFSNFCKDSIRSPSVRYLDYREMIHGHLVASMISGRFGTMDLDAKIDSFIAEQWSGRANLPEIFDSVSRGLKVLNISLDNTNPFDISAGDKSDTMIALVNGLDKAGIVVVTSAGNSASKKLELGFDKLNSSAIVVGAIDATGKRADFSQTSSKRVVFFAPGQSVPNEAELGVTEASGTSLSSPLVAGIVGVSLQILPELNRDLIENLLWYTGLDGPKRESDGMQPKIVNAYKFIRVVERLANHISTKRPLSTKLIQEIIQTEIKNETFFDFKSESDDFLKRASKSTGSDCDLLWTKISLLRSSYFLNPTKKTAKELSDSYLAAGYAINADYFQNLISK